MSETTDVVVIGAGVIGSSIALELARSGRRVLVVDKAGGVGLGSTSASSALIRFNYSSWEGVALSWEAWHGWQDWAGHLGHVDPAGLTRFHRTGMLVLDPDPARAVRGTPLFDRAGVAWEAWTPADIARRMPHLDVGSFGPPKPVTSEEFFDDAHGQVHGLFMPDAGYVSDPQLAAQNLASAARALGARYLLRRTVTSIGRGDDGWRLGTAEGDELTAPVVVNAAGPWSGRLNRLAGVAGDFRVGTRPLRQEVHRVPPLDDPDGAGAAVTVADPDLGVYLRADAGGVLVGGMEPACDPLEWLDDPDAADPHPTVAQFEAQVTRASRRVPELRVPSRPQGIAGVYDAADDWTPIYDKTSAPGFYVAMGTSGNQFKNAPVVGRLLTALIDGVEAGRDHDGDPIELDLPATGHRVGLGAFSRLREVAAGAPSSVLG